jgi:hypothetical protein
MLCCKNEERRKKSDQRYDLCGNLEELRHELESKSSALSIAPNLLFHHFHPQPHRSVENRSMTFCVHTRRKWRAHALPRRFNGQPAQE